MAPTPAKGWILKFLGHFISARTKPAPEGNSAASHPNNTEQEAITADAAVSTATPVADLGVGFLGFHGTPLLAGPILETG